MNSQDPTHLRAHLILADMDRDELMRFTRRCRQVGRRRALEELENHHTGDRTMTAAPQLTDDYLMDQETEAEITEAVEAETVSDTPWTPSPEDEDRVEHYLRALRYYRAEEERVKAAALAECERIGEWERKHLRTPRGAIDYLTHQLEMFSEATGRGKHDSPNGTLRWRKGRERIEIENEDAFCDSHGDTNLVRRTATPDKGAIKAYIQATGEIPDGADIVRGHDVFVALTPETQP